ATDEAVVDETLLDRRHGAAYAWVFRRKEAHERHEEQARVERRRTVRLHERAELLVETAPADVLVDARAERTPAFGRAVELELLRRAHGAVEPHPRHHLRVREVPAPAAHLPDAFVRLLPDLGEVLEERSLQRPAGVAAREARATRLMEGVGHFAVHVELELRRREVADAHGPRGFVAGQIELELWQTSL